LACNSSVDLYAGSEWIAFSVQLTSAVADVLIHASEYVFINVVRHGSSGSEVWVNLYLHALSVSLEHDMFVWYGESGNDSGSLAACAIFCSATAD
jgi:hypothetical protein